jgi:menaquinol-cytochrome c reductase iron-sulfur subunit
MHHDIPAPPPERRSFLKWLTVGLSGLFGVFLGAPIAAYLIDPRHRKAKDVDWKTVGKKRSALQVDQPTQVVIRDVRRDAWTLHPDDVLGRVWLIRRKGDDPGKKDAFHVDAYTTICPHLGCSINFEESQKRFICPCHNGTFDLQCQKVEFSDGRTNPAPRDMDSLACRPDPDDPDRIQVKYLNFYQGRHEKVVKG